MNETRIERIKAKTKQYAPAVVTGAALGITVTTIIVRRMYHPKDKVAIQLPAGTMTHMKETGQGLAINSNEGWFSLKYHPQD